MSDYHQPAQPTPSGALPSTASIELNGRGAPPLAADPRGKRIANRTPWIDLPEPFDNLRVRVWLDYPQEVADLLSPPPDETPEQASERITRFLKEVILQHDGWEDDAGVLPQPDTDEFWERIPTPLGRAIAECFFDELAAGNSRASRRAKRRSFRRR